MEGLVPAKKSQRFGVATTDLITVPIVLGILMGIILMAAPEIVRSLTLMVVNVLWLVIRDTVFSVGRPYPTVRRVVNITTLVLSGALFLIVLVQLSQNPVLAGVVVVLIAYWAIAIPSVILDKGGSIKLISLTGGAPNWIQAIIRNIFLAIPFILVPGYLCEGARILLGNSLIGRRIVYGVVFLGALIMGGFGIAGLLAALNFWSVLQMLAIVGTILTPVVFLVLDKEVTATGRLMDIFAKTQVVQA